MKCFTARMSLIDTLQHVDWLLKPKSNTNSFGCDSLNMLGIVQRELKKKIYLLNVAATQRSECVLKYGWLFF